MSRLNHRVSIAVRTEMGPPARPVTVTNAMTRYRQAMGCTFNPLINAELRMIMRPALVEWYFPVVPYA